VWVLSDGHDISSVATGETADLKPLREEVSKLSGQPIPWYTTGYAKDPHRVFTHEPTHISGEVDFDLANNGVITIEVQDSLHNTLRTFGKPRDFGPGHYDIQVELTVNGWAHGSYSIRIAADGDNLVKRIPFRL